MSCKRADWKPAHCQLSVLTAHEIICIHQSAASQRKSTICNLNMVWDEFHWMFKSWGLRYPSLHQIISHWEYFRITIFLHVKTWSNIILNFWCPRIMYKWGVCHENGHMQLWHPCNDFIWWESFFKCKKNNVFDLVFAYNSGTTVILVRYHLQSTSWKFAFESIALFSRRNQPILFRRQAQDPLLNFSKMGLQRPTHQVCIQAIISWCSSWRLGFWVLRYVYISLEFVSMSVPIGISVPIGPMTTRFELAYCIHINRLHNNYALTKLRRAIVFLESIETDHRVWSQTRRICKASAEHRVYKW